MIRANACRIAMVLLCVLMLVGCVKKQKETKAETTENPLRPKPGGAPAQGIVQRGVQRQVNQQLLRNIGQYYSLYRTENGRAPRNLEEFLAYVKSDPNARAANVPQALESGWVVMVFTPEPTASEVLAYEKEVFQPHQNRLVLFGDGNAVKLMTEPEFNAVFKAQ